MSKCIYPLNELSVYQFVDMIVRCTSNHEPIFLYDEELTSVNCLYLYEISSRGALEFPVPVKPSAGNDLTIVTRNAEWFKTLQSISPYITVVDVVNENTLNEFVSTHCKRLVEYAPVSLLQGSEFEEFFKKNPNSEQLRKEFDMAVSTNMVKLFVPKWTEHLNGYDIFKRADELTHRDIANLLSNMVLSHSAFMDLLPYATEVLFSGLVTGPVKKLLEDKRNKS